MKIEMELTPAQVEQIVSAVVERVNAAGRSDAPKRGYYTVREAAAELKVSEDTIYRMVEAKQLPRVPGMRSVRIPRAAIDGGDFSPQ